MVEGLAQQYKEQQLRQGLMQKELDDITELAEAKQQELRCVGWACMLRVSWVSGMYVLVLLGPWFC